MYAYMKTYCSICRQEMDGLRRYGKEAHCCGKECYEEWCWRHALAVTGEKYREQANNRVDNRRSDQLRADRLGDNQQDRS